MADSTPIDVQGRRLTVSNLEKVLYPSAEFTKRKVIDYYVRIAPYLIPHLTGRPLTMKRYPDGVDGEYFYEKNAPKHRPDWVKTAPVYSRHNRRTLEYVLVDDLATLVWLANLASLELHPSLSRAENLNCPTMLVFDLDPGPPANVVQCAQVALWLRELFEQFGLQSFPKTSGSKGLQIYVPLNTAVTYEPTKSFAHAVARLLAERHPDMVVSEMKKELRGGKVFIDWSQNDEHKTTVSVYSLRARERPTVSTPVTWEEVEAAWMKKKAENLVFEAGQVLERCEAMGDLFAPLLTLEQRLPKLGPVAVESTKGVEMAASAEPVKKPTKKVVRKR